MPREHSWLCYCGPRPHPERISWFGDLVHIMLGDKGGGTKCVIPCTCATLCGSKHTESFGGKQARKHLIMHYFLHWFAVWLEDVIIDQKMSSIWTVLTNPTTTFLWLVGSAFARSDILFDRSRSDGEGGSDVLCPSQKSLQTDKRGDTYCAPLRICSCTWVQYL